MDLKTRAALPGGGNWTIPGGGLIIAPPQCPVNAPPGPKAV